jgi:hypothetical protein
MSDEQTRLAKELAKVEQAIAAQEGLRGVLPDEQVEAALVPLREKRAALRAELASAGAGGSKIATGRSVAADRITAPVATGEGSIAAGGDVVLAEGGNAQVGGIRARRIEAESVVDGAQVRGGDAESAAGLVELAKAIRRGGISAEEIKARDLVSGLQYIADPTQPTAGELQREVAALREQLAQAVAAGEVADEADAEDAQAALNETEEELAEPAPQGDRVVRGLAKVTDILTRTADAAQALGQVGAQVIKLAPIAATLYQLAVKLFGG